MAQTKELSKFAAKFAEAPKYEPASALSSASTDVSSCDEAIIEYTNRKLERYTRFRDRLVFCLNVINMIVTCVLLTKSPQYYVYWNALVVPALILHRIHDYYTKGWHFYMVDFCYIVNFLVIANTLFFPKSEVMTMTSFGLSLGPLAFALWYFRNTYAFTSMDKMTSVTIHSMAPLTMFLTHWHDKAGNFSTAVNGISPFGWSFLSRWYGSILIFYGIWAVLYYLIIFVVFAKHINRRKLDTLYNYTMTDPKNAKKLLSRGARWSKLLFMFGHFRFVMALSTAAMAFYFSYWLGLVWLIGFHAVIIYNGATYCVEFHSTRYEKQFIGKSKRF